MLSHVCASGHVHLGLDQAEDAYEFGSDVPCVSRGFCDPDPLGFSGKKASKEPP